MPYQPPDNFTDSQILAQTHQMVYELNERLFGGDGRRGEFEEVREDVRILKSWRAQFTTAWALVLAVGAFAGVVVGVAKAYPVVARIFVLSVHP